MHKLSMKKVSVILPVYNVEQYVTEAVNSVLAQTYPYFELIVIDDGSTDRSMTICQQFTDPRIKFIHQQNRGLAGARNTGIRYAQGEYLAFLDSDDLWLPEKLEKHVAHLDNSPNVGVSFSRSAFIDQQGKPLGLYLLTEIEGEMTFRRMLCRNPVGNGSTVVIRRKVFEALRFRDNLYGTEEDFYFDERFRRSEDFECWLRITVATNWQFQGIPDALTLYRVNLESLSTDLREQLRSWEQVMEKARSYAPEQIARWEKPARAFNFRYLAHRAVMLKTGSMAVEFINRAVVSYWHIVLEEPGRTLLTLAAAYSLWLLPQPFYCQVEALAIKMRATWQKRQIQKEQSRRLVTVAVIAES
nr:glycosyltransferase family 2 protein [Chroococcidiopsis sp. CCALA 051]